MPTYTVEEAKALGFDIIKDDKCDCPNTGCFGRCGYSIWRTLGHHNCETYEEWEKWLEERETILAERGFRAMKVRELTAKFSDCKKYRHELRGSTKRIYEKKDFPVVFVGANPSKAGSKVDGKIITDNTANRFQGFAERFKATHWIAVNLFDYVETYPESLPVHLICSEQNDNYIHDALHECKKAEGKLIFCWGDCIKVLHGRDRWIMSLADALGIQPMCFNVTQKGNPWHPLYIKGNTRLKKFKGKKWDGAKILMDDLDKEILK